MINLVLYLFYLVEHIPILQGLYLLSVLIGVVVFVHFLKNGSKVALLIILASTVYDIVSLFT